MATHFIPSLLLALVPLMARAVDVNQANEMELDALKGVGPALSTRILNARAQAPFKDWADLMARVSGMGPHKVRALSREGLTVNGQALPEVPLPAGNQPGSPGRQ